MNISNEETNLQQWTPSGSWITDRLPKLKEDVDWHEFVWVHENGSSGLKHYGDVTNGTPWHPLRLKAPLPYRKPETGFGIVQDKDGSLAIINRRNGDCVVSGIPADKLDHAEKMLNIYKEAVS